MIFGLIMHIALVYTVSDNKSAQYVRNGIVLMKSWDAALISKTSCSD